jgi:hypothetical protein
LKEFAGRDADSVGSEVSVKMNYMCVNHGRSELSLNSCDVELRLIRLEARGTNQRMCATSVNNNWHYKCETSSSSNYIVVAEAEQHPQSNTLNLQFAKFPIMML